MATPSAPASEPANPPSRKPGQATTSPATSRLWFHLDDVLPLATHAASTPRHQLTTAQLLAHAPLMPALALTSEHGGPALTSNGDPAWYDADGTPHTARARTWIRRTAGSSTVVRPGVDARHGYLPLRTFGYDGFHVIDWLRHAAAHGRHWLSLDLSRPHPVISPDRLDVTEQHGHPYPPAATWIAARVSCVPHLGGGRYPALIADSFQVDGGGEIARFDRPTINQIIADLDRARDTAHYQIGWHARLRWNDDRLEVFAEHHPGGIPALRRYDVIGPDRDARYPLGALRWTWLRTDTA